MDTLSNIFFVEDYQFLKFEKWVLEGQTPEQLLGAVVRLPASRKVCGNSTLLQFIDKIKTPKAIDILVPSITEFIEGGYKGSCGILDIRYSAIEEDKPDLIEGAARVSSSDGNVVNASKEGKAKPVAASKVKISQKLLVFKVIKLPNGKGEEMNHLFFPQITYLHVRSNAELRDFYSKFWSRIGLDRKNLESVDLYRVVIDEDHSDADLLARQSSRLIHWGYSSG